MTNERPPERSIFIAMTKRVFCTYHTPRRFANLPYRDVSVRWNAGHGYWAIWWACRRLGTSPSGTLTVAGVPGFSIDVLPRGHGAWIPACAGMTNLVVLGGGQPPHYIPHPRPSGFRPSPE